MARPRLNDELKARRVALGRRLRFEREAVGLSQQQLADRLSLNKYEVQRMEVGEKSIPAELIQRLCREIAHEYSSAVLDRLLARNQPQTAVA